MSELKLYMVLLGCRPPGRLTEQHDIFFGIGNSVKDLTPEIRKSWPEAKGNIHLDAFREVTSVDGYAIQVTEKVFVLPDEEDFNLYFINLGGYKRDEFDEFHYKMVVVAQTQEEAITVSKQTAFFRHTGFPGAPTHVDDKYGVDVDDVFPVKEILNAVYKEKYHLKITKKESLADTLFLGFYPLKRVAEEF